MKEVQIPEDHRTINNKQKDFINGINEFCKENLFYSDATTLKEAIDYISRNIEEFSLSQMTDWEYNLINLEALRLMNEQDL